MGPRIKHFHTDKTGTEYSLRAIPLGGYVRLAGEEDSKEDLELEPNQLLSNQSAWVKIKVLGAGSFMNLLLTFLIMTIIAFGFGVGKEIRDHIINKKADFLDLIFTITPAIIMSITKNIKIWQ